MSLSSHTDPTAHQKAKRSPIPAYLVGGLLILIGIMAVVGFVISVSQDDGIQLALNWTASEEYPEQPSVLLAFLAQFGIVLPLLVAYLSIFFISIGAQVLGGSLRAAHWAQVAYMWLTIGMGITILLTIYNTIRVANEDGVAVDVGALLGSIVLPFLAMIIVGGVWWWLSNHIGMYFEGEDLLIARETRLAWNLLIPTLAIFILVAARPLEQTFIRSLTDKRFAGRGVPQFVGLDNYANLLTVRLDTVGCRLDDDTGDCSVRDNGSIRWESIDRELLQEGYRTISNIPVPFSAGQSIAVSGRDDDFVSAVNTTLIFTVFSVSLELLIGLFMAMVVNSNFRGRGIMRAVMLVPWAIPTVISARLWELILKDTSAGILNKVLLDLHIIGAPQAWLSEPSLQLPAGIIVDVWKTAPFMALLLLAGLQTIPSDLYEAAAVDGASPVRRFFSITLPLLRPALAIALVFRTLDALRVFDLFNVLFGRQQLSMATYNFETLVSNQQDGYASAISVIIFIFISIFAFIYVRMLKVETD